MVTVGVIGVGALGQHHARLYAGLPGVRLVGVCDLRPEVGQSVADRYGVAYFADWQDLAARVMAVSVAVPTCDHCTLSVALLSQGKHVLVEKPIAVTLEEAGQMIAAAEQAGVILQVGIWSGSIRRFRLPRHWCASPAFLRLTASACSRPAAWILMLLPT
jgi:predicted dehydrogenase